MTTKDNLLLVINSLIHSLIHSSVPSFLPAKERRRQQRVVFPSFVSTFIPSFSPTVSTTKKRPSVLRSFCPSLRYFEDDEEGADDLEYQPAPGSPTLDAQKDSDDSGSEEDPLEAFMAGIQVRRRRRRRARGARNAVAHWGGSRTARPSTLFSVTFHVTPL